MIPIGKGEDNFLIILALIRRVWIRDNERATKAIWILSLDVGVIPISSGLGYLFDVSLGSNPFECREHTVKL